jgi:two-component sensor histidine kinase/antitoxin component of RelBE/YafQ-DinJ toxin-antitoxin module
MGEKVTILLFEDNPGDASLIEEMLEEFSDFSYELKNVETLHEGLSLLKELPFDLILTDLGLPDSDGIATFLDIHARNSRIPIIIFTALNDEKIGLDAVKKGAQDYLVKGQVKGRLLKRSIKYSIERKKIGEVLANIENARKKEIHHRIKNNLQVISSLLALQADKFKSKMGMMSSEILDAFRESQDRVISIGFIHEELYKGEKIEDLDFSLYLEKLTQNLFNTYRLTNTSINLSMDIENDLFFDMDTAIPLGIIVNELISNSLKHAFPDRDKGKIQIKFCCEKKLECINCIEESKNENCNSTSFTLTVSDDGVGVPENLKIEDIESLGLQLVIFLIDQLDGELELKRNNGTQYTMRFTEAKKCQRQLIRACAVESKNQLH